MTFIDVQNKNLRIKIDNTEGQLLFYSLSPCFNQLRLFFKKQNSNILCFFTDNMSPHFKQTKAKLQMSNTVLSFTAQYSFNLPIFE